MVATREITRKMVTSRIDHRSLSSSSSQSETKVTTTVVVRRHPSRHPKSLLESALISHVTIRGKTIRATTILVATKTKSPQVTPQTSMRKRPRVARQKRKHLKLTTFRKGSSLVVEVIITIKTRRNLSLSTSSSRRKTTITTMRVAVEVNELISKTIRSRVGSRSLRCSTRKSKAREERTSSNHNNSRTSSSSRSSSPSRINQMRRLPQPPQLLAALLLKTRIHQPQPQ